MNELVQELAVQACVVVRFNIHPHTYKQIDDPSGMHSRLEFNKEKFAELIVKECAYIPIDMWDKAELNADVAVKIQDRIKQHFEVE